MVEVKKNQTQSCRTCWRRGLRKLMLAKCKGTPVRIRSYLLSEVVMTEGSNSCLSLCEVLNS